MSDHILDNLTKPVSWVKGQEAPYIIEVIQVRRFFSGHASPARNSRVADYPRRIHPYIELEDRLNLCDEELNKENDVVFEVLLMGKPMYLHFYGDHITLCKEIEKTIKKEI